MKFKTTSTAKLLEKDKAVAQINLAYDYANELVQLFWMLKTVSLQCPYDLQRAKSELNYANWRESQFDQIQTIEFEFGQLLMKYRSAFAQIDDTLLYAAHTELHEVKIGKFEGRYALGVLVLASSQFESWARTLKRLYDDTCIAHDDHEGIERRWLESYSNCPLTDGEFTDLRRRLYAERSHLIREVRLWRATQQEPTMQTPNRELVTQDGTEEAKLVKTEKAKLVEMKNSRGRPPIWDVADSEIRLAAKAASVLGQSGKKAEEAIFNELTGDNSKNYPNAYEKLFDDTEPSKIEYWQKHDALSAIGKSLRRKPVQVPKTAQK